MSIVCREWHTVIVKDKTGSVTKATALSVSSRARPSPMMSGEHAGLRW